jgi:hypothetical protein
MFLLNSGELEDEAGGSEYLMMLMCEDYSECSYSGFTPVACTW